MYQPRVDCALGCCVAATREKGVACAVFRLAGQNLAKYYGESVERGIVEVLDNDPVW